jgi:hypothetical protein
MVGSVNRWDTLETAVVSTYHLLEEVIVKIPRLFNGTAAGLEWEILDDADLSCRGS